MSEDTSIAARYLDEAFRAFRGYKRMAEGAMNQLTDQEFVLVPADTREELMRRWERSLETVFNSIQSLKPEDLARTVYIRGDAHTVLQATNRSMLHTAYHVGQILYLSKHLKGAAWKTLSIPKGQSAPFNALKPEDRKVTSPTRG